MSMQLRGAFLCMVLVEFAYARLLQPSSATTSMLSGRTFTSADVGGSGGALRLAAHIDDGQVHDSHAGLPKVQKHTDKDYIYDDNNYLDDYMKQMATTDATTTAAATTAVPAVPAAAPVASTPAAAANSGQTLKAGSSYTGLLTHPLFPNEEFQIRLDLTSATDGVWREEDQAHHHEQQKFTVKYEGDLIKMLDKRDQIVGKMDAKGIIHCEITRDGVAGGSLVLTPANAIAKGQRAHANERGPANATAARERAHAGEYGPRASFVAHMMVLLAVPLGLCGGLALLHLKRKSINA
eukprot:gnl/TRDRNA2_/TRDRNA2_131662_c0_seq1.p1 gnl/TRDRNA2_/TRDRNA2_131662_c0~~gnl/TRDRNA2_/TRDRNA2_131662_c0_seq1.p1  ORF type:complete len:295 (-),score=55.28 gnl/TRDRNA2_/TRDRNA2_131662_c0_seq1:81-965(-)